jgi:hypothetical protein
MQEDFSMILSTLDTHNSRPQPTEYRRSIFTKTESPAS